MMMMMLSLNRGVFTAPNFLSLNGSVKCLKKRNLILPSMAIRQLKLIPDNGNPYPYPNPKEEEEEEEGGGLKKVTDLGNGSHVVYLPQFLGYEKSWEYFNYLDKNIPWTRPTIRVCGKPFIQGREMCYIARKGLAELIYSGYKPEAYSWEDFPPLEEILDKVHKAFPGSHFNSLLLNRYNGGNDHVGWHADDHKLYGPNPEIASISFGCERDFFLKKKSKEVEEGEEESVRKRAKKNDSYSFKLKHGSVLVMGGNTQRDWLHSVPKRAKADSARINLTFRRVM